MSYILQFSQKTDEDLLFHKKSGNKAILKKIITLLKEIAENPYSGTGKPEALKYDLVGKWFRRINQEHRLVYKVEAGAIFIAQCRYHY